LARPLRYKEIQPRFPSDHSRDPVAAIVSAKGPGPKSGSGWWRQLLKVGANVEQLGILAKSGAHGNMKSYLELNFIRENTHKKAAFNVSETI